MMKKYAIYGINRVEKDFRYMFPEIRVVCYFENDNTKDSYCNLPVYPIKEFWDHNGEFDKVIICGFDKEEQIRELEEIGLLHEKDYILEEELFNRLDDYIISDAAKGRKVVLWGTGRIANRFLEECPGVKIDFFLDSDEERDLFYGKRIYHPEEIENWDTLFIVIAMKEKGEVIKYLKEHGRREEYDYIGYEKLFYAPSAFLRRTIFDQSYYEFKCDTMKNHFEINDDGDCAYCCAAFQNINAGNLFESEFKEIWNGNLHRVMCLSAENHTYTFCNKKMCPLFFSEEKQQTHDKLQYDSYQEKEEMPSALLVAIDKSCNLNCITCREHIYLAKGKEKERSLQLAEIIIQSILPEVQFLILAGNGEVFLSEAYRQIYLSEACAKVGHIRLLTNGLLLTEKNWNEFYENNHNNEIILTASIDAASKETYERIRRNGKFEVIRDNMELASRLKKEGKISYIRMNFVVQKENYQEMPDFVEWAVDLGADEAFFTKILNWGTYTDDEFRDISMMEKDTITAKKELKEILQNPIMKHEIVEMGTINYLTHEKSIQYVKNYYEWELTKRNKELF